MTHVTEQLSSVEISTITPRAFDAVVAPGSHASQVAQLALEDYVTTVIPTHDADRVQLLAADSVLFTLTNDGLKDEMTILDDEQQRIVGDSIEHLAANSPLELAQLLRRHLFPAYIDAMNTRANPLLEPTDTTGSDIYYSDARPWPEVNTVKRGVLPHTFDPVEASTLKETTSWRTILKVGPLAIGFAVQPKHAQHS